MEYKKITQEEISSFMEGKDPQERIVNITYEYGNSYMNVIYRDKDDNKCIEQQNYYPFVWATGLACTKLCDGNRNKVKSLLNKYHIGVKKLSNINYKGEVVKEFENGYMFMFFAIKPMSYTQFQQFFKEAGNPIYRKNDEKNRIGGNDSDDYLTVTPVEQFMIHTGKRFFKGYDDYDQILRMIFDLETEGLNPKKDRIKLNGVRLNRPVKINGRIYGTKEEPWSHLFQITGETEEEKNKSELEIIELMCKLIYTFKPDVITAHNGENFDWNFLIVRAEMCGSSMEEISKKYFNGDFIRKDKKESILKLGGEIEKFRKTIVPNIIITDSLHAVRRAQATDSNFKEANLKYSTKYLKLKKENRVYTPGKEIDNILTDVLGHYALNVKNGDWYKYDPNFVPPKEEEISFKPGKVDNKPFVMYTRNYLMNDYKIVSGEEIIKRYLFDDLWECDKVESKLNTANFFICKILPLPFSKAVTMGTAGQWKAILMAWSYENNLAIPIQDNASLKIGGLSRLTQVGYSGHSFKDPNDINKPSIAKLDYNSLYPSITLSNGYTDWTDLSGVMLPMLNLVLTSREKFKKLKKLAGIKVDEYDKKIRQGVVLTYEEKKDYEKSLLDYALNDKIQNSWKILGNSFFGSLGSTNAKVFPWKSTLNAHQITSTGRQMLRMMIYQFINMGTLHGLGDEYNYGAIVGDTDGYNMKLPMKFRYTEENPYISTGAGRVNEKGKEYTYLEADVAEFNDLFLYDYHPNDMSINKLGMDIDETITSSLNISRKNYVDFFGEKNEYKFVGNSIKNKRQQRYCEIFLNKGLSMLAQNKGKEFIEYYYEYIEKIYNYQIPLKDIATKGKIKKSMSEYIEDTKTLTKAGRPKSRQAWYELAIRENLIVDNGDTVYYINTGTSKSQTDVKKISHIYCYNENGEKIEITKTIDSEYNKLKRINKKENKETIDKSTWLDKNYPNRFVEDEIILNCVVVPQDIIDSEYDIYSCERNIEYNVPKYIEIFNNKVKPLLVCFDRSIRYDILITNPENRKSFTEEQCQLVSGQPNKPGDQDNIEDVLKLEDKEIFFYLKYNLKPLFLKECGQGNWEDIVNDYNIRKEKEKQLGIDIIREEFDKICEKLTLDDLEDLIENGTLPKSISKIVSVDPISGDLISTQFPDVVIAKLADFIEMYENFGNNAFEIDD